MEGRISVEDPKWVSGGGWRRVGSCGGSSIIHEGTGFTGGCREDSIEQRNMGQPSYKCAHQPCLSLLQ